MFTLPNVSIQNIYVKLLISYVPHARSCEWHSSTNKRIKIAVCLTHMFYGWLQFLGVHKFLLVRLPFGP